MRRSLTTTMLMDLSPSPAEACLRRRPEVRSQNARIGVAAGVSALVTLRDCAALASMRWGNGDGAGVVVRLVVD